MLDAEFDVARLRADFPILARKVNGKPLVYLDNGASAQKPRVVIDAGWFQSRSTVRMPRMMACLASIG